MSLGPLLPLPPAPCRPPVPSSVLELHRRIADVNKDLKLEQQRRRRHEHRQSVNNGLTASSLNTVLAVFVLSGYRAFAAAQLASRMTCLTAPTLNEIDWQAVVVDIFFACTHDEIAAVHFPDSKQAARSVDAARRFLSENALVGWVRQANFKGVVPPSSEAYREHLRLGW